MADRGLKIAIDSDDAATGLKNDICEYLKACGADIEDLSYSMTNSEAAYPDIGYNLAQRIKQGQYDRGILLCGTGIGMAIIANKIEGIYAGVCHDVYSAERLRKSNNAQILTMGARVIGPELAKAIVKAWLTSEFEGGRSQSKVDKIHKLEQQSFHGESGEGSERHEKVR